MTDADRHRGATVVFATRHGKQDQAAEVFRELLDARVVAPDDIDTDQFGTFTGETARVRTPRQAALDKARLGIALTGHRFALASEATYTSAWPTGSHHELLVFLDDDREVVLTEEAVVPAPGQGAVTLRDPGDALAVAARFGFPDTRAVVVWRRDGLTVARKGLTSAAAVTAAVADAVADVTPDDGTVLICPDLRAHANPARRRVIADLSRRMAERLARPCPACRSAGWGRIGVERGLRCSGCGTASAGVAADVLGCAVCDATEVVPRSPGTIEPEWCEVCNP
ncbi:DUF6671 family protein [Curtobacterium sp. MCBA15_004]|uniref:DUF6671 family protein n=1 Tax=unclassified Curtobacterium TaxID=257496 RepID=UPI0008DD429F|nr:DUF6671 family protein [Curtobacterium sp. MCBA15_004]WIA98381.1 hypothetical protein QOL16_08355 [Curtobacterium sp. MCBA15_004]